MVLTATDRKVLFALKLFSHCNLYIDKRGNYPTIYKRSTAIMMINGGAKWL
jgi:hypothetical protein